LLIKSQALLPRPPSIMPEGEEDVGDDLVKQLLLYKQYKEVARSLGEREAAGLHTFVRLAPPPKIDAKLDLTGISIDDLLLAVRAALDVEKPAPAVGTVVKPFTLTIRDQMGLIERTLQHRPQISFKRMLADAQDRVEIIVTFLAVLELLRRRKIQVLQDQIFGDIVIEPSNEIDQPSAATESVDDEESEFEIPKVAEEHPAEEFKFDAEDESTS
jgi:segregation and condensation protein A